MDWRLLAFLLLAASLCYSARSKSSRVPPIGFPWHRGGSQTLLHSAGAIATVRNAASGPTVASTNTPCGSILTGTTGSIKRVSASSQTCRWIIQVASGNFVRLTFQKIDMADDPTCTKSSVIIRNGTARGDAILLRTCGKHIPTPVASTSNLVQIEFVGAEYENASALELLWKSVQANEDFSELDTCGLPAVAPRSVINGAGQGPGVLPWVVGLTSLYGRIHCGGAMLNSEWIVTAAHCFTRLPWTILWKVRAGEWDLMTAESTEQVVGIQRLHVHSSYNPTTHDNDIALVQLAAPLRLTAYVKPICLPGVRSQIVQGRTCSTAGWGAQKFLGHPSEPLTHVLPKLTTKSVCNRTTPYEGKITDNMLCAGGDGIDTCQGDGGGPLSCPTEASGRHFLTGIASWGNGCAFPGTFGVYTDVAQYLEWMSWIMANA